MVRDSVSGDCKATLLRIEGSILYMRDSQNHFLWRIIERRDDVLLQFLSVGKTYKITTHGLTPFISAIQEIPDECKKMECIKLKKIKELVDEQLKLWGLWFEPQTPHEDYLQEELKKLHTLINEE